MQTHLEVYPWSETQGLCRVLRDPSIWSSSFPQPDIRRVVKRAAKKTSITRQLSHVKIFNVTDDEEFGSIVIQLLESLPGRRALTREFAKEFTKRIEDFRLENFISRHLYNDCLSQYKDSVPRFDEIFEKRLNNEWYFVPANLVFWLTQKELSLEDQRILSLYACYLALQFPEQAPAILQVLIDRDESFLNWLSDEEVSAEASPVPTPRLLSEPAKAKTREEPQDDTAMVAAPVMALDHEQLPSETSSLSADSAELVRLLTAKGDWDRDLPVDQLRSAIDLLRCKAERHEERLTNLDELHRRVSAHLKEVAQIPWLESSLPIDSFLSLPAHISVEEALVHLTTLERRTTRLLDAHLQVETLGSRLGSECPPYVPSEITNLVDIVAHLEEEVAAFTERLQQISLREEHVAEFFDRFIAADQEGSHHLIGHTEPERWLDIVNFIMASGPKTDAGNRYKMLVGRFDLVGFIVAHLWHLDTDTSIRIASSIISGKQVPLTQKQLIDTLAFLTFAQIQQLTTACTDNVSDIAEIVFAAAIGSDQLETLEYLEPLLDMPSIDEICLGLYRAVLDTWRRGLLVDPARQLNPERSVPIPNPSDNRFKKQRLRLLELVRQPPGMKYNYHRLRILARAQFFSPLEKDIEADNVEAVLEKWTSYGSLNEMVEACIRASGKRNDLDRSHSDQTLRYLETFQTELRRWYRASQELRVTEDNKITDALISLQREASLGSSSDYAALSKTLCSLFEENGCAPLPAADFGQRCIVDAEGNPTILNPQDLVQPTMTQSWPVMITKGAVPLSFLLSDYFRQILGIAPASVNDAIEEYLRQNEFHAAQDAADGNAELQRRIEEVFKERRSTILTSYKKLIDEARSARIFDEYIDLCLTEIDSAFDALNITQARDRLNELDQLIRHFKTLRDPARTALVDFFKEAGLSVHDQESLEELRQRTASLRTQRRAQRLHILKFEDVAQNDQLPSSLRETWSAFARRMDRPAFWPNEENSRSLADAIETFVKFILGKLRYRDDDPDTVDMLVQRLEEWILTQLRVGLDAKEGKKNEPIQAVLRLAQEINEFSPDRRILQLVGESELSLRISPSMTGDPALSRFVVVKPEPAQNLRASKVEATDLVSKLRADLQQAMIKEFTHENADTEKLRDACLRKNWIEARSLAASLFLGKRDQLPQDRLTDIEAVYTIALAHSFEERETDAFSEALENACLATVCVEGAGLPYYLGQTLIDQFMAHAIVAIVKPASLPPGRGAVREQVCQALAAIANMGPADTRYQWFSDLFWKASRVIDSTGAVGSAKLATQLWEVVTGAKNVSDLRSDLLYTLESIGRMEALEYLAQRAKPLDDLVAQCLTAFERSRSDPEVRPQALQISAALQEQASKGSAIKPWLFLFRRLESAIRVDTSEPPLSCSLESDSLIEQESGSPTIEIRLVPSPVDPPKSIFLELGSSDPSGHGEPVTLNLFEEDLLLKERILPVQIPLAVLGLGREVRVPYRFSGVTIRGHEIDLRGHWTLSSTAHAFDPIPHDTIRLAWPGATGNPVSRSGIAKAFYGREQEIRKIETLLLAPDRQHSVMIFGQRRIGKTSLLLEMVESLPPRRGGVCAAFFDVSGLEIPNEQGSMPKAFFDSIVTQLEENPENLQIRSELEKQRRQRVDIRRLTKDLDPHASLYAALESLVERLGKDSKGTIPRLALFVDEFDRFVEPLLRGRRDEVNALMWNLRQIVQRSKNISLVLAGSGLQRLLVDNYQDALYGSIDEIVLKPFDWDSDHSAIQDTFLPPIVRDRLCNKEEDLEAISRHAFEICGGHPWYLAVLGHSTAVLAQGRLLTPALLNRVAEFITRGEGFARDLAVAVRNDPSRFYSPIFESLERLNQRSKAVAMFLLAHIAQRVTAEYPWLATNVAINPPGILGLTDEKERLDALKNLEKEGAIEVNNLAGNVRIRIPLTAEAVRAHAITIRQDAVISLRA